MYRLLASTYTEAFYAEWQLNPDSSDYNIVLDLELAGAIDVTRLDQAIKRLVTGYLLLNSHLEENKELYWVKNKETLGLEYYPDSLGNKEVELYIRKPFNLATGPLYRFCLIKANVDRYRLIVVVHNLVTNNSKKDLICTELANYYNDASYVNKVSLEEQLSAITQFSKQLSITINTNREESKQFWQAQLADIEPIDLSFLKLGKAEAKQVSSAERLLAPEINEIGEIGVSFDEEILIKLDKLRHRYQITTYLYGQSICAMILHRYTSQYRFGIGYLVEIEQGKDFIYGTQINTNIIPYDFTKINNFLSLVDQSIQWLNSLGQLKVDHSYLPMHDILTTVNKEISYLLFTQVNFKDRALIFDKANIKFNIDTRVDLLSSLTFEQVVKDKTINYTVRYRADKINAYLLKEFVDCYRRLFIEVLNELIDAEDTSKLRHIKDYSLLSSEQYDQIIYQRNQTGKEYPRDKTIHQLFEEQVERAPDSIALVFEEVRLTYKQLNERANKLANDIRQAKNIEPGALVALCLDRNERMLIAILAVLKTGGAYVPIDPTYPDERIKYVLEDTAAKVVLTNEIHKLRINSLLSSVVKTVELAIIITID